MRITLTEKQIVMLDWDGSATAPKPVKRMAGGRKVYDLTQDQVNEVKTVADGLSWGSDFVIAAKALVRKIEMLESIT